MSGSGMSMVLTCYNRQEYIKEAILSVFAQDYDGPMQLVIVDDASTDDSVHIIEKTVQEHGVGRDVEIVKLNQNLGVAGATDAGWAKAKYDWILIVDGDDVQLPERCSMVEWAARECPHVGQISFAVQNIDANGRRFGVSSYNRRAYSECEETLILDTPEEHFSNIFGFHSKGGIMSLGASTAYSRRLWDIWGPLCIGETACLRFEQDPTWAFRCALSLAALGSKNIAVAYRSHASNLSNITLPPGVSGEMQSELFQEKYQSFHAASLVCMLRDLERARHDSSLTNWPSVLLEEAKEKLEQELAGCQLRSMWWSVSYFERVWRVVRNWRLFRQSGTSLLRLLPFRLFCLLKYWRKRQK